MTLCPIALMTGCKKCPALSFCPLKSYIGDYGKHEEKAEAPQNNKEEPEQEQDKKDI